MVRLQVEQLESRLLVSGLQPTDTEQLFLELLNQARFRPAVYGKRIGLNLNDVARSYPLAFNPDLIEAARLHSLDMHNRIFFAHVTPDGIDPGQRIDAAGYHWLAWSESIAAGL